MPTNAQLFEYEPFRRFCISIARSSYLVYNLRLSQTTKKTAEKIDTNAQWFHCSWSILLKRVNIRVRGFHLVLEFDDMVFWLIPPRIKRGEHAKHPFSAQQKKTRQGSWWTSATLRPPLPLDNCPTKVLVWHVWSSPFGEHFDTGEGDFHNRSTQELGEAANRIVAGRSSSKASIGAIWLYLKLPFFRLLQDFASICLKGNIYCVSSQHTSQNWFHILSDVFRARRTRRSLQGKCPWKVASQLVNYCRTFGCKTVKPGNLIVEPVGINQLRATLFCWLHLSKSCREYPVTDFPIS